MTLCSGRGIHDTSTAELVLTLVLASLRGVPSFVRAQDRHEWTPGWHPALADKTVLLVGYGAIGPAIEARLAPFECDGGPGRAVGARRRPCASTSCPRCCPTADVVVLVVPLTDETRGLVDAAFLSPMKDGALLVNVARGAVVDTDALVAELRTERIRAALDVVDPEPLPPDSPLWDCARPADLPARRRLQQRDVAPRLPPGPRPAAPHRGRRGACEHHVGRLLSTA